MGALSKRLLLVAALLVALPAAADDTEGARAHYARGTKLFDLGRYLDAAKEYEATYELKDDPALLYNIGQAYRLGNNFTDAIRAYKSFLRRVPNSPQRPQVEGLISDMQRELALRPAPTPPPVVTPPTTTPTPAPIVAAPTEPTPAPHDGTPVYKKWWLWTIVGGVVVAGVVVGVTVGVLATRDSFGPSLGKLGPSALTVSF